MSSDALYSAVDCKDYTANPSEPVDLQTDSAPDGSRGACRRILPLGTGTLAIKLAGSGGTTRTLAVTEGIAEDVQAISLETATNVAVRVYW